MKKIIFNFLFITVPSLIVLLLILELVTRIFLSPSDIPDITFDSTLGIRYVPNQRGVYMVGNEVKGEYRINSQGWNSPSDYVGKKTSFRVAVIGDSYVGALQVDYDKSYPYLLEKRIGRQVYTFGRAGANLIQYANVLRYVKKHYTPDLVIINIVHADFIESIYGYGRKDMAAVKPLNGSFVKVAPECGSNMHLKRLLRKSAFVRYLIVNLMIHKRSKLVKYILHGDLCRRETGINLYEANVNMSDLERILNKELLARLTEYAFGGWSKLHPKIILVMDTNRRAIYAGKDPRKTAVHTLINRTAARTADKLGIPIVDLTDVFESKWKKEKHRFEFNVDNHWNTYAHGVVADAVSKRLSELGWI